MAEETSLVHREGSALTAAEIRAQVNRIQEVMREVMEKDVHFGTIPGTGKPSLWKPGAEKLGMTFHLAIDSTIDADLSTEDLIRYRVRAAVTSQASGIFLGAALGECSSNEEKYKWRAAVSKEEWEDTPVDRRRNKWKRGEKEPIKQVRTEPADLANTILKMAVKRAEVAAILKVTAASDIFTQDIEDLPEEVREEVAKDKPGNGNGGNGPAKTAAQGAATPPLANAISEAQAKRFYAIWKGRSAAGWNADTIAQLLKDHNIANDRAIPKNFYDALCKTIEKQTFDEYMDLKTNPRT